MKTVKNIAELKQLALRNGATVSVGATKFNTTGSKVTALERPARKEMAPPPPPPASPPVAPPAPATEVDMTPVAQAMLQAQQLQAGLMQSLAQQITQLAPGQPVQEWEFTVNRNPDGTLASIRAKAIR